MSKSAEKFYIVAIRHNPQLGSYVSGAYVGSKRMNKNSVSGVFDYYGSRKSLRFSLHADSVFQSHFCLTDDNCVYGSMEYYGFDDSKDARNYIEKSFPSQRGNYAQAMKVLGA